MLFNVYVCLAVLLQVVNTICMYFILAREEIEKSISDMIYLVVNTICMYFILAREEIGTVFDGL